MAIQFQPLLLKCQLYVTQNMGGTNFGYGIGNVLLPLTIKHGMAYFEHGSHFFLFGEFSYLGAF
jgi:hypothetical protein